MVVTDYVHVYSLRVKRKPECTMHHWQLKKTNKHLLSTVYSPLQYYTHHRVPHTTHMCVHAAVLLYTCMISRTGTCSTYVSNKLNLFQPLPAQ